MTATILTGFRVLVVEDEWFIADDLAWHLETAGAIVLGPVPSVREALNILNTPDQLPDVASLDFNLLAGDTSIRIAEELDRLYIPFVFATGTPELIPVLYQMRPVCPKPVVSAAWLQALAEAMSIRPVGERAPHLAPK